MGHELLPLRRRGSHLVGCNPPPGATLRHCRTVHGRNAIEFNVSPASTWSIESIRCITLVEIMANAECFPRSTPVLTSKCRLGHARPRLTSAAKRGSRGEPGHGGGAEEAAQC